MSPGRWCARAAELLHARAERRRSAQWSFIAVRVWPAVRYFKPFRPLALIPYAPAAINWRVHVMSYMAHFAPEQPPKAAAGDSRPTGDSVLLKPPRIWVTHYITDCNITTSVAVTSPDQFRHRNACAPRRLAVPCRLIFATFVAPGICRAAVHRVRSMLTQAALSACVPD